MRTALLASARKRLGAFVIDDRPIVELLTATTGLTVNVSGETYAPSNQWTLPGDGRRYDFANDVANRRVKSIEAKFRYTLNTPALGNFIWIHHPSDGTAAIVLGVYDEWNAQNGFRLVSDIHDRVLNTSSWNDVLKKTFDEPVYLKDLYIKVGGRSGYTYNPVYMSDLKIEFFND